MKRNLSPALFILLVVLLLSLPTGPAGAQASAGSSCKMALAQGHHEVRRAQNERALELFREALSDPTCAGEAQLGLATAYNADNKHKKAIQAAEAALRLVEDAEVQAEAHYQIGLALDRRGTRMTPKKEQAVNAFEKALELSDGEHRGAVRALLRIFKETKDEARQASLEERFPGVQVATRAEQRRALKPKKRQPDPPTAVASGQPTGLSVLKGVGSGDAYDCKTLAVLAEGAFEERSAEYDTGGSWQAEGDLTRPEKIEFPTPGYTREDRERGVSGTVILQAIIDVDGTIPLVRIINGLSEGLNFESVKSVCAARFEPARDASGEPVAVYYNLTQNFRTTAGGRQ